MRLVVQEFGANAVDLGGGHAGAPEAEMTMLLYTGFTDPPHGHRDGLAGSSVREIPLFACTQLATQSAACVFALSDISARLASSGCAHP